MEGGIHLLIRRMNATFGRLQGQSLELREGLNIIQAPNETGKSTWCAFLTAMLYGINSRERDRAGFIAEKNRYAPWNGGSMSGRLDCRVGGDEITLTRTTRRQTSPMGEFQAVYSGTGNPVDFLTGANCGEALLGVSREVYERSAFIRQAGLSITQDAGLERRIASLITTGEESVSFSEAAETLKRQLNRRRHNKTGQIPVLETQLQELQAQLHEAQELQAQLQAAQAQTESFTLREAALANELAQADHWADLQKLQALQDAEQAARTAEESAAQLRARLLAEQIPETDTIGRLRGAIVNLETTRKAVEHARAERDEAAKALLRAEAALNESPFAGQTPEQAQREAASPSTGKVNLLPFLLAGWCASAVIAAVTCLLYFSPWSHPAVLYIGLPLIPLGGFVPVALSWKARKKAQTDLLTKRFGTTNPAEIEGLAETYAKLHNARAAAQAEADRRSSVADTLYNTLSSNEQGILLEVRRFAPAAFDIPTADALLRSCAQRRKELQEAELTAKEKRLRWQLLQEQTQDLATNTAATPVQPTRSRDAIVAELEHLRAQISSAKSSADQLSGRLHAAGDVTVLRSAADQISQQITALEQEYAAISMAMDALNHANTALQNRFSPELGRRAAEIFSALTDGRYDSVVLDRSFHLFAEPAGDSVFRDAQLLSAGAVDQLYLATRLAICDLVLPESPRVPIVLDDALTNFDNDRCAAALRWLRTEAEHRQILLFTCHNREAEFFAGDEKVSILRLTEQNERV